MLTSWILLLSLCQHCLLGFAPNQLFLIYQQSQKGYWVPWTCTVDGIKRIKTPQECDYPHWVSCLSPLRKLISEYTSMMTKMHADQHDKKFRKKARASYYGEAIGSIQPPWHACFAAPLLDSRLPCSVCPKEGCIHMEFCWSAPTLPSAALHNVLELQNGF